MKGIGVGVAALIGLLILIVAISAFSLGYRWLIAEPKGRVEAREQILSGTNRIAQYDYFFNLCAGVQSDEASIVNLQRELETGPSQSRREQINASITGLRNGRAEKINQYNVDAAKGYTAGRFRASKLPFQLDPTQEVTVCVLS
jgi:hypothetical protein